MTNKLTLLALASSVFCALPGCTTETEDASIEVGIGSVASALQTSAPAAVDASADADAGRPDDAGAPNASARANAHLRIKVREIRVHIAGDDDAKPAPSNVKAAEKPADSAAENSPQKTESEGPDDGAGDGSGGAGGWVVVFSGERTIDLDRTVSVESILGSAHAKPGKLTQVRLILDGSATLVENGTETPVACGSCNTSGLKIVPKANTRVEGGARHRFVLEVDLDKSLIDEGGQLRLKPVLRLNGR